MSFFGFLFQLVFEVFCAMFKGVLVHFCTKSTRICCFGVFCNIREREFCVWMPFSV